MRLIWDEKLDENGNSFWEAKFYDSYYRIVKKLINNEIVYCEDSLPNLWLNKYSSFREKWSNIGDAKYDMYRHWLSKKDNV